MNTTNEGLEQDGLLLKGGTLVDATLIHAAPSTKNREKTRDPDKHQTKKGNQWYPSTALRAGFDMKIHVGADVDRGVVHTLSVTPANVADVTELPTLPPEDDRAIFGDAGYVNDQYQRAVRRAGVYWGVALKARPKSLWVQPEAKESQALIDPQSGRTGIPGHQVPIWLHSRSDTKG